MTVAVRFSVPPTVNAAVLLFSVMPETGTVAADTVTTQVAVLLPSTVVTVMVAVPVALAVTTPALLTVAAVVLLELHVTF